MKNLFALALMSLSLSALAGYSDDSFDRALTKAELQKLLPQYVAMVESQAAALPSATENQVLASLAYGVTNPTYYAFDGANKVIGRQSHTAETLVQEVESALAELKQVTPEQRQKEAADLVAGFKGASGAGKIRCRLGYENGTKDATGRIVKCEDDRSVEGKNEEEGYYDVRSIILSIDAKTLAPVSTLKLYHLIAG